jgi:glutamate-1-semialdehyde 2,1-aminomutase
MKMEATKFPRSVQSFANSRRYLAGGVSSSMRAAAKPVPLFFSSASGSKLTDVDGNHYIDYTLAWGPMILGHSHPAILAAVSAQLQKFQLLGAQHELEVLVAKKICEMVPCAERVAFSSTGSEAVQSALRLVRAFTGRRKIIRFEGHYHGWLDNIMVGYRPDLSAPAKKASSENMGRNTADDLVVLQWNDLQEVEAALKDQGNEIAAIITEPILCNTYCLSPAPAYLEGLRRLATQYGVVLIFDEVITGFRAAPGGAQALLGVKPDMATFAKAVAGGFALSVVAGSQEIMGLIDQGKVAHTGTFNGNPISLAAALATLETLDANQGATIEQIRRTGETLMAGIQKSADAAGIAILINGIGASFHVAFTTRHKMLNFRDTLDSSVAARDTFLQAMLAAGIYLLPDGRWYVSSAHTAEDVEQTLDVVEKVFAKHKSQLVPPYAK